MEQVIVTRCGKKLRRHVKPISELKQREIRNAMVNCGTDDDDGKYVEIQDVHFIPQNIAKKEDLQ